MRAIVPAIVLTLLAAPLAAQSAKQRADCRVQTRIVQAIVDERAKGAGQDALTPRVVRTLEASEETARYAGVVETVIAWVYSLPEEHLTPEAGDAFETVCLAQ